MNVPARIGRYEVLCELGRGGMAELYLARLYGVGGFAKLFAIKRILPHLASDRTFVEQFLNEGRLAARLSHPNVCQVYELGEADGVLYLVMEYLEGVTWEELALVLPLEPRARLRFVVGVMAQACDGFQHAHEQTIVHRDVSPTNIFVTVNGVAKVLDFGVSKLLTDGKHTRTGVLKGKLPYMSPEQIEGTGLDHRSDVFAAGVVVWEAIAGRRLYDRETDFQIWKAITEEPAPPLGDAALDRVVGKALERKRDDRYPTIAAFADELRALVQRDVATSVEIGALVREQCKVALAERAELVHSVITNIEPRDTIETRDAGERYEDAGATASIAMRAESVVLASPARRRWPVLAIAGIAAAVAVVAIVLAQTKPPAQPEPPKLASAPAPVMVDAAAEIIAIDAAPPKPVPHVKATPKPTAKPTPKKDPARVVEKIVPTPPPAEPQEPGSFTIESRPFARIYVDGSYVGETPLYRHRVKAGAHTVRAVLEDGRQKTFQIKIVAAQEVNSGTLTW